MTHTPHVPQTAGDETISPEILHALTDVKLPQLPSKPSIKSLVVAQGWTVPVRHVQVVVVGSGAAGLRAAVELHRRDVDVCVVTQSAYGGTSACSGSDKQTLHTANSADQGDNFKAMAEAIGAGGAMEPDVAYIEAVGSTRALSSLQYLGLPLPVDRLGGVLRYQTDHDEVGRATSCGPRTSRLMVQVLAREAIALGMPVFNHTTAVRMLTEGDDAAARVAGVLCIDPQLRGADNPYGVVAFLSDYVVLAAGGPGELYRDSVYPRNCFGPLGLALEVGIEAVNLTESQFGIGTARDGFPWNLSGTYAQCMPYVYATDAQGVEQNFLADYYRSTQELASNIFRKGYQWPFHAARMLDFGSSLFDLAVFREMQNGRKVYMDFNRNPQPVADDQAFSLQRLDADVQGYLAKAGALLDTPIERLRKMNPLSIALYQQYKVDIEKHPLLFAMNNQHMNGGLAVDNWGQTSLPGCYAVGEAAGTHGVTRPGGSALNAGQVFGTRCAEHIATQPVPHKVSDAGIVVGQGVAHIQKVLNPDSAIQVPAVRRAIQARMSDAAGMICHAEVIDAALQEARALTQAIQVQGMACSDTTFGATQALQWRHNALASQAILEALAFYVARGGGSRGARVICHAQGECVPVTRTGVLEQYRFIKERAVDKGEQIFVSYQGAAFTLRTQPLRAFSQHERPFFECNWPDFLSGRIYQEQG